MEHKANTGASQAQDWESYDSDPEDPIGKSRLDLPITVTTFPDYHGMTKTGRSLSLHGIADLAEKTMIRFSPNRTPPLPCLVLGTCRDKPEPRKQGLKTNGNMIESSGLALDFDDGKTTIEDAVDRLTEIGVPFVLWTTKSHSAGHHRFRVLLPFSGLRPLEERDVAWERMNALFDGHLDQQTFIRSQGSDYGWHERNGRPTIRVLDGRRFVNEATELPRRAKDAKADTGTGQTGSTGDTPRVAFHVLASALWAIPNDRGNFDERDAFWTIAAAVHHTTRGSAEGLSLLEAWVGTWKPKDRKKPADWREKVREEWKGLDADHGKPVTFKTLMKIAERYGWRRPDPDDDGAAPPKVTVLTPDECAARAAEPAPYIWKGMVAPGDLSCIFGMPGVGKSLIAPYVGYAIARGEPAFGMRTRAGPVLYVAAEDPQGMIRRVGQLRHRYENAEGFRLVEGLSILTSPSERKALCALVEEHKPSLVIVDTLGMAFAGIEEVTSEGMGVVLNAVKAVRNLGPAVLLVAHPNAANADKPRGHGSLNADLFMSLKLNKGADGVVRGTLMKNRNGRADIDLAYRIEVRDAGTDEDGDPITQAVLRELDPATAPDREGRLTPAAKAALEILTEMIGDSHRGVPEDKWRQTCIDGRRVSSAEKAKHRGDVFRKAYNELARAGRVEFRDGLVYLPDETFDDLSESE